MDGGFLLSDSTCVNEGLDVGVVVGELAEFTSPHEVRAGVSDMDDGNSLAHPIQGRDGGTHAGEIGVGFDDPADRCTGVIDRVGECCEDLARLRWRQLELGERGDGGGGRELAGRVTAHAIGDDEQAGAGVARILIAASHEADIRPCCVSKAKGHLPLLLHLDRGAPDPKGGTDGEESGRGDACAIDPGAVGGAEVLDEPGAFRGVDAGMAAGRVIVLDHQGRIRGAPDRHLRGGERDDSPGERALDDDELAADHLRLLARPARLGLARWTAGGLAHRSGIGWLSQVAAQDEDSGDDEPPEHREEGKPRQRQPKFGHAQLFLNTSVVDPIKISVPSSMVISVMRLPSTNVPLVEPVSRSRTGVPMTISQ